MLISLIETRKQYRNKGIYSCGIFVDLQKAFDTVVHDILLKKLLLYGVRAKEYNCFGPFLANRKQHVSISMFF